MRKVLWAVDAFTDNPQLEAMPAQVLGAIAPRGTARVEPLYVYTPYPMGLSPRGKALAPYLQKFAMANLERVARTARRSVERVADPRIEIARSSTMGGAVRTLLDTARRKHCDLIAVATHGRKGKARLILGSFAETLLLHADVPVLFVNPSTKPKSRVRHIVFPTDFSLESRRALEYAVVLAKELGADLFILHRMEGIFPSLPYPFLPPPVDSEALADRRKEIQAHAQSLADWAESLGVKAKAHVIPSHGSVSDAVVRSANRLPGALVVMAGRSGAVSTALAGSATRAVVRSAACPVLVIPRLVTRPRVRVPAPQQPRWSWRAPGIIAMGLALLLGLVAPVQAKERPELDPAMRRAFEALINLQLLATTPEKLREPEHAAAAKADLNALSVLKHAMPEKMKNEEPGMAAIVGLLDRYVQDTTEKLDKGYHEYVRSRVRTLGTFCLNCHTRVTTGTDFEDVSRRVSQLKVTDLRKAEFYAATRQFDKAMASYVLFLDKKPADEMGVVEYSQALRQYVRLAARVKNDPDTAFKTLDRLSKRKDLPEYLQRLVAAWKKDAAFWLSEKTPPSDLTAEALLKRAKSLIERAESLKGYRFDDNGDISYLRATGYLHEALERNPKAPVRAEALYLLGVGYQSLSESLLWDLDALFFEACIRENPKTEIAKRCFGRYAERTFYGYTGSAGTFLPPDELNRLEALRHLAYGERAASK